MGEAMPAKTPEQQAVYDAKRKRSEQLLVRLSGRLSHFFTVNDARASFHREEIHETLRAVQDLMCRVQLS